MLEGDICGCFDYISHRWMLSHIRTDREVLEKWLRSGFVDNRTWFPTEAGTPQGGIISPTLANLTLDGLEELLAQRFPRKWSVAGDSSLRHPKVHWVRSADDFIITGASCEMLENEVRPLVASFLSERRLMLSPEKTKITHIHEGFDFLGQNLRKFGEKLLLRPSQKNTMAFLDKVRTILRDNRSTRQENVIWRLNPVIRGWANHHRHITAKRTFTRVDWAIWQALWHWAQRRYREKSRHWLAQRCWHAIGSRTCAFATKVGCDVGV